ncbi:MAG TPA: NCS2 family permease [Actinomycetota bacterium]|jgi:AGZA family xanthine/uracil permease-like MFS transporter
MALDAWAPPKPSTSGSGGLDRFFHVTERGSTVRTELIAGFATWLTMSYILFVNPQILGSVKDKAGTSLAAPEVAAVTALVAGVITLLMGVYANYPFALAAGLGLNAFVTFTLVATFGLTWPQAMGIVVLEGLIITVLVLTGFREAVLNAIPMDLKRAIGVGIGLFIAFIGLVNSGIVVHPQAGTIVALNPDLTTLRILIFAVGLAVTMALVARRIRGALLFGIIFTTVLASIINAFWGHGRLYPPGVAELPSKFISTPDLSLLGNFSLGISGIGIAAVIALVLSVMLSDFFDTMGTVVGLAGEAGLLDKEGRLPGVNRVLLVDSLAALAGGAASSSSNTTYIESAAGISEGGRTGLTSVVVGALFLLALFFSPWAGVIPSEATAPVLIVVGYFMMTLVKDVAWDDPAIGIPALLTIIVQPFTFSITNGVGAGFIAYTVIRLLQGRIREIHPLMAAASIVFMWYFVRGLLA